MQYLCRLQRTLKGAREDEGNLIHQSRETPGAFLHVPAAGFRETPLAIVAMGPRGVDGFFRLRVAYHEHLSHPERAMPRLAMDVTGREQVVP